MLSLGLEGKERVNSRKDVIETLQGFQEYGSTDRTEDWQTACESLSREEQVRLFKGLLYADIVAWGGASTSPVNTVFARLNKSCWPDTVYGLIGWAKNVCSDHHHAIENYAFANMLENR